MKYSTELQIITDGINKHKNQITKSYFEIGKLLFQFDEMQLHKETKYKSVLDYAEKEFQFSRKTTQNLIRLYVNFGHDEKYKSYNYSQLREMLSIDSEKLNKITSEMTVSEIISLKKAWEFENKIGTRVPDEKENITIPIMDHDIEVEEIENNDTDKKQNKVIQLHQDKYDIEKDKYISELNMVIAFAREEVSKLEEILEFKSKEHDIAFKLYKDLNGYIENKKLPEKLVKMNKVIGE
jgi:hypothetical protein